MATSGQVPTGSLHKHAFAGELSLMGELVSTPGTLSVAMAAARAGLEGVVVPAANGAEAALVEGLDVVAAPTLRAVVEFLRGQRRPETPTPRRDEPAAGGSPPDLAEVRGQSGARPAMEIAAAGGHHLLMVGPPGAGKVVPAGPIAWNPVP